MRGVYEAKCQIAALVAGATLIYVTAPADKVVEILGARIGNSTNETNEQLVATLQRVATLGTPTATTLTPAKSEAGDAAAGSVVKGPVTASEPSYTANTEFGYGAFASLAGWMYQPTPEERMIIAGQTTVGLRLLTASPTSFTGEAAIIFREIG